MKDPKHLNNIAALLCDVLTIIVCVNAVFPTLTFNKVV